MSFEAYGEFQKVGPHIFRTAANLRWGTKTQVIGSIIMLNPGKSSLADKKVWHELENGDVKLASGKLEADKTMETVAEIMEKSVPRLDGNLHIYNLFNLREPESSTAMDIYKKVYEEQDYQSCLHADFSKIFSSIVFPWIWLAWSVEDNRIINDRKRSVVSLLPAVKTFALYSKQAKFSKSPIHIYHPLQRTADARSRYKQDMIDLIHNHYKQGSGRENGN